MSPVTVYCLDVAALVAATAWAISVLADGPFGPAMLVLLLVARLAASRDFSRAT